MRRTVLVLVVLLAVVAAGLLLARPVFAQGASCIRIGGDLIVSPDQTCSDDAVVIGGNLLIQGYVGGNAVALFGSVQISGQVGGDIVALNGAIVLEDGAQVTGSATTLGGQLRRAPGAVVQGNLLESGPLLPQWARGIDRPTPSGWAYVAVTALAVLMAFGVSLVLAAGMHSIWPRRTQVMVDTLRRELLPSLGLGLAGTVLAAIVLPLLSLLLLVTLIGTPVIPFLYLVTGLLYAAGMAVAGLALGQLLTARRPGTTPFWLVAALGLAILVPLTIVPGVVVPWVGPLWAILVPSIGAGAIILSRVGTVIRVAE